MSRWICDSDIFGVLWIFVEISRWILLLLKNLWVRLTTRLTLASARAAGTTAFTAGRLADLLAMIDEHTAAGTMSGRQVAEICSMIDASCSHDATEEIRCEKGRRWRAPDVGTTRCYKQLRRLGKGAFGLVVKAQHRDTGQIVALKTIRARDGARRPDAGELLREACFMAACRGHPFLVGLHGVVRNPDTKEYCLVMNYVGPTLRETVDRRMERHGQAFPEAAARRAMRQLLTGARAMHERGIIHRDIKPKNILVGDDGVKICDYGVAMFTAMAELPFAQAGTPSYMAPEVLLEKPEYDERVDLWSLGCVMAELLSGQVLFEKDDKMDQLRKIFDTLGVPGKRTWQGFKSTLLAQEVQQWRAQQQEAPHHDRLRELFPEEVLSEEGFHVLKGLLRCNPRKRLTAATALRSAWFKDDAINTSEAEIGGTVLVRETLVPFLWMLISAWARFRQVMLSALLRHKALPKSVAL